MNRDRMILGKDAEYSCDCNITNLNNNVLVAATSGAGKTMSITEPCLIGTVDSSVVVTVTKRRIVEKYMLLFDKRGYKTYDLNFVNPEKSTITYDPLSYISSYTDITFLAKAIVMSDQRKEHSNADPYWDETAISLLCAEITYVLMTMDDPTFVDVLVLHESLKIESDSGLITTSLDDKFDYIELKKPGCFAISCWKTFRLAPVKTASCIYSTLNTTLDTIFSPELRKMIGRKPRVDFEKIATEKTALFVSTSPVNPSLNTFVNMFYSQMFKNLFEFGEKSKNGVLPISVKVICDDFATGSRIVNFPEYISIFREKGISVILLLQSESQLENMYGSENAVTIINNCDTYVYMGGNDLKTGRNISERLNAPLEDVLYMPIGNEYIFRRGQRPIMTKRYELLKDKEYQELTSEYNKTR